MKQGLLNHIEIRYFPTFPYKMDKKTLTSKVAKSEKGHCQLLILSERQKETWQEFFSEENSIQIEEIPFTLFSRIWEGFSALEYIHPSPNEKDEVTSLISQQLEHKSHQAVVFLPSGRLGAEEEEVFITHLASYLGTKKISFFKEIPGFFTANPRSIQEARLINHLTFPEALEFCTQGAQTFTPQALEVLQHNQITATLFPLSAEFLRGTKIDGEINSNETYVKGIVRKDSVAMLSIESLNMWGRPGFLADLFAIFKENEISVDLISTSQTNVTLSLDSPFYIDSDEKADQLFEQLQDLGRISLFKNCSSISVIGPEISSFLGKLGPLFKVFDHYPLYLMGQASNNLNLTFVVESKNAKKIEKEMHQILFAETLESPLFGPSWEVIQRGEKPKPELKAEKWWAAKKYQLLELAQQKTPMYVYHQEPLRKNIQNLKSIEAIDRFFYSIKANSHKEILKVIHDSGFGFECVSQNEIHYIEKHFPQISHDRVLFTPNFCGKEEFDYSLSKNYWVTVDNFYCLENWPELFKDKKIILRLDPGKGRGHHDKVKTAGPQSKFGVGPNDIEEIIPLAEKYNIKICGLHAHAGSGILDPHHWSEIANFLFQWVPHFSNLQFLNLGGGLHVPSRPLEKELNLGHVNENLKEFKQKAPHLKLWMEPGRYLVANTGVLLSQITQTKRKSGKLFIGINTGMNSLIRPSLYGSYHHISNLSRLGQEKDFEIVQIVGPICETGDILGNDRPFPKSYEGDIVVIDTAGAYGYVMGSQYNLRPPADQTWLS